MMQLDDESDAVWESFPVFLLRLTTIEASVWLFFPAGLCFVIELED